MSRTEKDGMNRYIRDDVSMYGFSVTCPGNVSPVFSWTHSKVVLIRVEVKLSKMLVAGSGLYYCNYNTIHSYHVIWLS